MSITAPETRTADGLRFRDIGEFRYLDPRKLVLDPCNVRTEDTEPDQAMLESVEQDSVEVALIVRPQEDGNFGVLAGQIRMLSAQEVARKCVEEGRPDDVMAIPCMIRHDLVGQGPEVIARAVAKSIQENLLRRKMTARDTMLAAAKLELPGLSKRALKRVARSAGLTVDEVHAAQRAASMDKEVQQQASEEYEFDLQQLLDLGEVQDVPGALEKLADAREDDAWADGKGNGNWEHAMAQLRQEKQEIAETDALREKLTAAGMAELPRSYTTPGDKHRRLSDLLDTEGQPVEEEQHNATCPGRAFAILRSDEVTAVFLCADWEANRHQVRDSQPQAQAQSDAASFTTGSNGISSPASGRKPELSAYEVGQKNKLEQAAREVREKFIKGLIAGKLSDAAVALTQNIQTDMPYWYHHALEPASRLMLARYLDAPLPPKTTSVGRKFFETVNARFRKARRASNTSFAQVAMAFEHSMGAKKTWAHPSDDMVVWLLFLKAEGYTLSGIEQEMVDAVTKKREEEARAEKEAAERAAARAGQKEATEAAERQQPDSVAAPAEDAAGQEAADAEAEGQAGDGGPVEVQD
ncbi:hypothetical protein F7Q99_36290 [Streptomyces kaniharaensis]|uniref:ParB/Sulfiredoxin domain-containing protein n=1 Tax=Streptomyces kaniharaensis TaxID=212423 RepID=A0A6N7L624_9ACTN|nr:hypothetical protein [Streptomyces kaniharaensis]MQS17503.1 hypothetical protein [Streptomyces kaniharaensis]